MKIILSPAKKMICDTDSLPCESTPSLIEKSEKVLAYLKSLSYAELKSLWKCNDSIAKQNFDRLAAANLYKNLTPAILAYDGIAFKYMAPSVFTNSEFSYVQSHLRILSAVYGAVRPMDGIIPYRLEMQAKAKVDNFENLYDFWGEDIYKRVIDKSRTVINLASKEYSQCVEKYLCDKDRYITVTFCEQVNGKLVTKGTYAKMARGETVRFMAENNIEDPRDIKKFNRLGYFFREDISMENEYIFERKR